MSVVVRWVSQVEEPALHLLREGEGDLDALLALWWVERQHALLLARLHTDHRCRPLHTLALEVSVGARSGEVVCQNKKCEKVQFLAVKIKTAACCTKTPLFNPVDNRVKLRWSGFHSSESGLHPELIEISRLKRTSTKVLTDAEGLQELTQFKGQKVCPHSDQSHPGGRRLASK